MSTRSLVTSTVALPGSMRARARYGVEYVASTILAARAKPASTSPWLTRTLPGRSSAASSACVHARRGDCGELGRNVPLDRHAIERRLGLVPGVGDDGDAAAEDAAAAQRGIRNRELHGGAHAGHRANRVEVVALDVAAVDRARLHGRPFHAGHADVDRRTPSCPVTFSGTSRFFCSVPISVHWSGGLMVIVSGCGCGVSAARRGDLPVGRRAAARRVRDDAVPGASAPRPARSRAAPRRAAGARALRLPPAAGNSGRP